MPSLERLHAGHAPAVLAFETANRAYFAASVTDRGDDFFDHFAVRFEAALDSPDCAFYAMFDDGGSVLGRFNLYGIGDGTATVGYRVAEHAAGRGVATAGVLDLCRLAVSGHGLRTLRAAAATRNVASQRVLLKAGFVAAGPADPAHLGGKPGTWFHRSVVGEDGDRPDRT